MLNQKIKISAVMLSNTANKEIHGMTLNAIETLKQSVYETKKLFDIQFDLILVESNSLSDFLYPEIQNNDIFNFVVINSNQEKFNYNASLNLGFSFLIDILEQKYDYHIVLNNDLVFEEDWLSSAIETLKTTKYSSLSPYCPDYNYHWDLYKGQDHIDRYREGFDIAIKFCGWCLVFDYDSFHTIYPFDEQFKFHHQDNDLAKTLYNNKFQHCLDYNSRVKHLFSKSHDLIPKDDVIEYLYGSYGTFMRKWNK